MGLVKDISNLLVREFVLELRQAYAINSILLYLGSVVFICYLSMGLGAFVPGPVVWNALFWIVLLFVSVNGVAKSFMLEGRGRQLYYYVLASPLAIILSKMVYNSLLTIVLAFAGLGFYGAVHAQHDTGSHRLFRGAYAHLWHCSPGTQQCNHYEHTQLSGHHSHSAHVHAHLQTSHRWFGAFAKP